MDDQDSQTQFEVSLKSDRDGFLRRSCPTCGRDFKTEINTADLQWELAVQCRRMGADVGEELNESVSAQLRCPYCAHVAAPSEMHTEETVAYLKQLVYREVMIPQLNQFTSGLEDMFPGGGHSGGLSISLEFNRSRIALPPRPIHGPEPPDLKMVDFLCCRKKIKVSDAWAGIDACVYCGTRIAVLA